ncbi:Phospholipid-transporting ATPase 1 [Hordeum vulgare]|nr:Phospholipid-transporting ATPase 1 [Hordeum vulgare]
MAPKKKKKELTHEYRAVESAKRKGRTHAHDARGEAAAFAAITATAQQEDTNEWVKAATREALLYLGVGLEAFTLDHEFPKDNVLEEDDDDMDIDDEPLFEEELANQTVVGVKPKCKSKQTKAYTSTKDKLLCDCWR